MPPLCLSQILDIFIREVFLCKVNSLNIKKCQVKLRADVSIFRSHFCENFNIIVDAVASHFLGDLKAST